MYTQEEECLLLPPAPPTHTHTQKNVVFLLPVPANNNKEDEEDLEYIYEEKYLATDFRKFLQTRKDEQ